MNNQVHSLGVLEGNLLVFGGVYSNLQALESIQKIAILHNISSNNIICTGDLLGFGAQPNEVINTIREWKIHCIAGNIEIDLTKKHQKASSHHTFTHKKKGTLSQNWIPFIKKSLHQENIDWIAKLPYQIKFKYGKYKVQVIHGSYHLPDQFIFESTPWYIKRDQMRLHSSHITLAGHTGLPFSQNKRNKYWINPGALGLPANDGTPRVWYAKLNLQQNQIKIKHIPLNYNYNLASLLMSTKEIAPQYAHSLISGLWPQIDILPKQEKKIQGKKIQL